MICVDRSAAAPGHAWERRAAEATAKLTAAAGRPERLEFDARLFRHPDLAKALQLLFGGKCAYCESRIDVGAYPDIELFRPRAAAVDLNGASVRPGYWWLAYSWENIYIACQRCNRNKMNRFPVAGRRARRPEDDLAAEHAILLDPCADDPAEHLLFDATGRVASRSKVAHGDRGAVTIDILGLNRPPLVAARLEAAEALRREFELLRARGHEPPPPGHPRATLVADLVDTTRPYVGLQRQLARDMIDAWAEPAEAAKRTYKREQLFLWQGAHEEDLRRESIEDNADLESRKSQCIARVEIENFRGIRELAFDCGTGSGHAAGWTMLIGENGVGKSSVLQALAIALMGDERVRRLGAEARPADLLRRGSARGSIRVFFAADSEPLEVRLTADRIEFGEAARRPRMIVLGFGSSRWLPRPGGFAPDRGEYVRVGNLFNPFVPLADTLAWLGTLDARTFRGSEAALLRLLRLDAGERLVRRDGEVLVRAPGEPAERAIPLRQLSDGYHAVVAMVGDIMELLAPKRLDMADAEGLILVDELEAHLHPRWKMQIVSRLRAVFPGLQFVTTTHDPLCLRGLHNDEVLLLLRDQRGEVVGISELPSLEALRVDQLLTSPYFGLHSTRDPQVDADFDEYYDLLARRRLTAQQQARLEELRTELDTRQLLGTDRREHLMLEAIDKHLAREADALADGKDDVLSRQTAGTLASILDRLDREIAK